MERTLAGRLWRWFKGKLPWTVRTQDASEDETLLQILHSEIEWRRARNIYYSGHPTCEMCGSPKKPEVHHVLSYAKHPDYRYDQSNLITLCHECHFRFGHGRNWRTNNRAIRELAAYTMKVLSENVG